MLRDRLKNEFTLPVSKSELKVQQVPFVTSASLVAKLLADTLKKEVWVQRKAINSSAKIQYAGLLDSLYVPMLHESDNMIAEHLLLLIGAKNQCFSAEQQYFNGYKTVNGVQIASEQLMDLGQMKINIKYTDIKMNQGLKSSDLK